ncbi:hypothetical protein ES703_99186 [subsurface metagenome]
MLKDIKSGKIPVPGPLDINNLIEAMIQDLERITERLDQIENFLSSWEAI